MLLSRDRQFLFIHIPKTAGTSIRTILSRHACQPELFWENRLLSAVGINVNVVGPWWRKRLRPHCSSGDVQRHLPAEVFDRLFKFAFVRNPWDLLVSLYNFIPTRPTHRYQNHVASLSFPEFVNEWTMRPEIFQARRICDRRGALLMDFVGFFEDVARDFEVVCRQVDITAELPRANRSNHADYREVYSDRLRRLVAARLAEDIEFLGYDFDGPMDSRKQQLQREAERAA